MAPRPSPWPRWRDAWWVYVLAAVAMGLFSVSLVVGIRCGLGRCAGSFPERLFSLDRLGGLPRLYTSALFGAGASLCVTAARRSTGSVRRWWKVVAAIVAALALAKLVSAHSTAKGMSAVGTLAVGVVLTVVALGALTVTGRRWRIGAAHAVVLALGTYAAAALGLDAVTSVLASVQHSVGALTRVATTFAEEFGEALSALLVLVTLRWQMPGPGDPSSGTGSAGAAPTADVSARRFPA